jgi:hypothetical protein
MAYLTNALQVRRLAKTATFGQFRDIGGDAPRLVAGEQMSRRAKRRDHR